MKAILKFDLTDPDDRQQHKLCLKAPDMASVLFKINHNLRNQCEQAIEDGETDNTLDIVFGKINDLMEEHYINEVII